MEWSYTAGGCKTEGRLAAALITKVRTRGLHQVRKRHLGQRPEEEIDVAASFEGRTLEPGVLASPSASPPIPPSSQSLMLWRIQVPVQPIAVEGKKKSEAEDQ